jgi:phosphoserine phosphatase
MELAADTAPTALSRGLSVAKEPAFATIVLDVDTCISTITGLEWLAARRGDIVAHKVASLSARLRAGDPDAYAECLAAIRPRRDDVDALSSAYVESLAAGAIEATSELRRRGVRIVVVTRAIRPAIYRLAYRLAIDISDLHAVNVRFDALGAYLGFDHTSPLTSARGRKQVLSQLDVEQPMLVVGDDAGERRITSFDELTSVVLA